MPVCAGIKRDGGRCTAVVGPSQTHCYQHDPARAGERSRNASRAARSRPSREISDIKRRLSDLADDVLEGGADKGAAAVAGQLLNTYIRAVGMELKVKEVTELEERIEALELHRGQGGAGRWGA